MNVYQAGTGLCIGIHRAYAQINLLAAEGVRVHAGHRCKVEHKNVDWDALQRIQRREPDLMALYPHLSKVAFVHDFDQLSHGDHLAVGHHGLTAGIRASLEKIGVVIHDFNCPFIEKMDAAAVSLAREGYHLVLFGKPGNHHCLAAQQAALEAGKEALITEDPWAAEREMSRTQGKWACLGQVTGNVEAYERFVGYLSGTDDSLRVVPTLCPDAKTRQAEAVGLAAKADAVIVVDDGGGASTSVFERCLRVNQRTYRYSNFPSPWPEKWLDGVQSVALVGGILVPPWVLDQVAAGIPPNP